MSIKDLLLKIKVWGGNSAFIFRHKANKAFHADFFTTIVITLVAFAGFGLGRLSALEGKKLPIFIEKVSSSPSLLNEIVSDKSLTSTKAIQDISKKSFVASKSGTKYYFPWCGATSKIKEENKIWFGSETEAKKAGYTPAANCAGLK